MAMAIGEEYFQTEVEFRSERKMTDWRLQGQEKYLKGVVIERKKYQRYRAGWEHDHCAFFGAKFSEDIPDTLHIVYSTTDNYHWICDDCYKDFKSLFEWKMKI